MDNPNAAERIERHARNNIPLPLELLTPLVLPGYEEWVGAFLELGTNRQLGMGGLGPIPSLAIDQYCSDWPRTEAALFKAVMRAMDNAYLNHDPVERAREKMAAEMAVDSPELVVETDNAARDSFRAAMRRAAAAQAS